MCVGVRANLGSLSVLNSWRKRVKLDLTSSPAASATGVRRVSILCNQNSRIQSRTMANKCFINNEYLVLFEI